MTRRSILTRITTIALAAAALAAPTALARPADMPASPTKAAAAIDSTGFPTRPIIDRPSYPPNAGPATPPAAPPARDIAWTTLGIAAGLLALAGIAAITSRTRRAGRPRIAV